MGEFSYTFRSKPHDASPQATQTRCLQVPLQRGRDGRKERLQQEEARRSRTQRAQPPRDQAHAVPQVPRLRERALLVELVLLLFDQEGIDYLQKFLNLPADVVPATLKKSN